MKPVIFFLLLCSFEFASGQSDSVQLFISPKDNFVPIDKNKIVISNNTFSSTPYNFSIKLLNTVKTSPCQDVGCIFAVDNDSYSIGFGITEYSRFSYSKKQIEILMRHLEVFKKTLREGLLKQSWARNATFISDSILIKSIGGVKGYEYQMSFEMKDMGQNLKGLYIVSQVFFKRFNYHFVGTMERGTPKFKTALTLYHSLVQSFKILDTSEKL